MAIKAALEFIVNFLFVSMYLLCPTSLCSGHILLGVNKGYHNEHYCHSVVSVEIRN